MPHLTLEYSDNLPREKAAALLETLHNMIGHAESVDIETLKSRLVPREVFLVGAYTTKRAFVYGRLDILPGRSAGWKKGLGTKLHLMIEDQIKDWSPALKSSVNFEIRELDGEFYHRSSKS